MIVQAKNIILNGTQISVVDNVSIKFEGKALQVVSPGSAVPVDYVRQNTGASISFKFAKHTAETLQIALNAATVQETIDANNELASSNMPLHSLSVVTSDNITYSFPTVKIPEGMNIDYEVDKAGFIPVVFEAVLQNTLPACSLGGLALPLQFVYEVVPTKRTSIAKTAGGKRISISDVIDSSVEFSCAMLTFEQKEAIKEKFLTQSDTILPFCGSHSESMYVFFESFDEGPEKDGFFSVSGRLEVV